MAFRFYQYSIITILFTARQFFVVSEHTNISTTNLVQNISNITTIACTEGQYKDILNTCQLCTAGSWCVNETQYPCPNGTTSPDGSNSLGHCLCSWPGTFGPAGGPCEMCTICLNGEYEKTECNALQDRECGTCGVDGIWCNVDNEPCPCTTFCSVPGQAISDKVCNETHDAVCETCSDGQYATMCVELNQSQPFQVCLLCEENFYCNGGLKTECPHNSTSTAGASALLDCKCIPGFCDSSNASGVLDCQPCPIGCDCNHSDESTVSNSSQDVSEISEA